MNSLWTPQFLFALGIALALGNVLAIGIHTFTWWLRKKPVTRLVIACLGGLALLLFLGFAGYVLYIFGDGQFMDLDGTAPPPPANWKMKVVVHFLIFSSITCGVLSFVGVLQMRQIPARWHIATLCFCCESALALLTLSIAREFRLTSWFPGSLSLDERSYLTNIFSLAFIFSLLLLALFRSLFLVVLKYICHKVNPTRFHTEQLT